MTLPGIAGIVLGAILLLELVSAVLIWLMGAVWARPIWRRRRLLAAQSRKVERLANATGARARIHAVLGWDYRPDSTVEGAYTNGMGLRGHRTYASEATPGVRRIAAIGDSFTFAGEVADEESWAARIEQDWCAEVLNYGVGAYGPDQVYLRYLDDGHVLRPETVLVGFLSLMASRVVSRYRGFQTPLDGPWFKPRYVIDGDDLRYVPPPIASREDALRLVADPDRTRLVGENDFWYVPAIYEHTLYEWSATYRVLTHLLAWAHRRYLHPDRIHKGAFLNPDAEAFQILRRLYRKLRDAIRANGAEPIVMMFPTREDVELYARRRRASYQPLAEALAEDGLRVIDLAAPLAGSGTPVAKLFAPKGHLSVAGNAIVARAVAEALALSPRTEEAPADA